MVAMILAWLRDFHVLHHSQRSIVVYVGGLVPTFDIKNIAISFFLMALSHFLVKT